MGDKATQQHGKGHDESVVYRYVDDAGRDVVTNELSSIPAKYRAQLDVVDDGPTAAELDRAAARIEAQDTVDAIGVLHPPSFVFGAVSGALLLVVAFGLRKARMLSRVVGVAIVIALVGSAYFGWVMKTAGLSGGTFQNPARAIDEANAVRDQANARTKAYEALERDIAGR